ncbi:MAG TPA: polysaccharide biosynthesis C-terminal domain-containing protein [Rhizomicrobium sp.]|nr:polysaccharide biosynthesis C-terminal domain-containing protein [Rhizomicrobium sp.]
MTEPKGRILANALNYMAGQGAIAVFGLASSIVLARYLPKAVFGQYSFLLALAIIFMPFLDMGGHTLYLVEGARDRTKIGVSWSRAVALKLRMLVPTAGVIALYFLAFKPHTIDIVYLLVLLYTIAQSMLLSTDVAFRPAEQGRSWAIRRVVYESTAFVLIVIALTVYRVHSAGTLLLIAIAATTAAVIWAVHTVVHLTRLTWAQFWGAVVRPFGRAEIRALWPFALNTGLWVFYYRETNIFLENFGHHAETDLADFRVIFQIMTSALYVPKAVVWASVPRIAFHDEQDNREEFRRLLRQFSGINTWLAAFYTLGGLLYGEKLIGLVFGHKYAHLGLAWTLFDVVLGLMFLQQYCTDMLNGIREEHQVVRGLLFGVSILTVASFFLVPLYGTVGAAIAQILAAGVMVPLNLSALARRVGSENLHGVSLIRLGAALAVSGLCGFLLLRIDFYLSLAVFLAVMPLSSYLLGAFPEHFDRMARRLTAKIRLARS